MIREGGRLLVVEDDDAMRALLEEELRQAGHAVSAAASGNEALAILDATPIDVVVSDLVMPGLRGDDLLAGIRRRYPEIPVVIITAFGSIDSAVAMVKSGAFHYLAKPFRTGHLLMTVANALRERRLRMEIRGLRDALGGGRDALVAEGPAMRSVLEIIGRAAAVDSPVLILGESGSGKELVARALHDGGPRRTFAFQALNCSAIPETLLESQLFGHRRGAFTDAREDRRGLIQEADGGTLFLDEVGDMPLPLQSKLLRVLQAREIQPLGAASPVRVDVRVVAATHRDLEALIAAERFRQDLYFRLDVIEVRVPPLRERPEDLVPLVALLLEKHCRRLGRGPCTVSLEAMEALRRHSWPGNVRELQNALERALVLGRDDVIWPHDLPEAIGRPQPPGRESPAGESTLADVEREHILTTLRSLKGNKAAAARVLGLDRKTLYRRLDRYGAREP
ncbi:MAG TPA: sigma-54 dependent transcriptional regulator [Candidatus Cryosericum sp.]|nr:sigma-54 dependent transcriptional regulator [Candidatus Cryosericum sp.]